MRTPLRGATLSTVLFSPLCSAFCLAVGLPACVDRAPIADAAEGPAEPEPQPVPEPAPQPGFDPEPPADPGSQGMTWRLNQRFSAYEVVDVGCGGEPGRCDPYVGDTPCTTALPYLCFEPGDAAPPDGLAPGNAYHRWSGGAVRLTPDAWAPATDGVETFADADAICADAYGEGWRVVRFHDGWGWNLRAFGDLPEVDARADRFWALIDDQAQGNCVRR